MKYSKLTRSALFDSAVIQKLADGLDSWALIERTRANVAGGGREFLYGLPEAFRAPTAA